MTKRKMEGEGENLGCPSVFAPPLPIPQSERKAPLQISGPIVFNQVYQFSPIANPDIERINQTLGEIYTMQDLQASVEGKESFPLPF